MTYAVRTRETAQRLADDLNRQIEEGARFRFEGHPVRRFEVRAHSWTSPGNAPLSWGVVPRWRYRDNPTLGEFGGAFMPMLDVIALVEGEHA